MKNCTNCKNATWQRTSAGSLHPSGDGVCNVAKEWKCPPIPACSYWLGSPPTPCGVSINRKRELKDHCTFYSRS